MLTPHSELVYVASAAPLPFALDLGLWRAHVLLDRRLDLGRGTYFLKSALSFQVLTRKSNWYQFATTPDLLQSLTDPSLEGSQELDVEIFLHGRLLRPVLSMALLFMSLPLVLGGYGRRHVHQPGLRPGELGGVLRRAHLRPVPRQLRRSSIPPTAWAPLMGFGMIATLAGDRSGPERRRR